MKLILTLLISSVSLPGYSKSCFDRKFKKKYEKCLKVNLFGNQKKCKKKKKKWQRECDKIEGANKAKAVQSAKYKSVEDQIKKGRIANQSLEVWKDGKPLGWSTSGKITQTAKGGFNGSVGAIVSGQGSLVQTRRLSSRKWHGLYLRSNFSRNLGSVSNGVKLEVTIKKNGNVQRIYKNDLNFPYVRLWEINSIAIKPELYDSEITVAVKWDLTSGTSATLDEIRLVDIAKYEKDLKDHRNYLKKEALK